MLDALETSYRTEQRPWGYMRWLDSFSDDLTIKYLAVGTGQRTSLQRHSRKDELLIILGGTGHVEAGRKCHYGSGRIVRIRPGTIHRVTGPLTFLEVSTFDDGTDTIRLTDDYGRHPDAAV